MDMTLSTAMIFAILTFSIGFVWGSLTKEKSSK